MTIINPFTARLKALLGANGGGLPTAPAQPSRSYCRDLAPWEEITHFDIPVMAAHTQASSGAWELLITGDPQRVGLWISGDTTYHIAPEIPALNNTGIWSPGTSQNIIFREKDDGPLPSLTWYVNTQAGQIITTLAIRLRDFPECGQ